MPAARGVRGFPRTARVLRARDFEAAFREGRRWEGRLLVLVIRRRGPGPARLGIVASRKVGGAVLRNRAKRLLREIFRGQRPDLPDGFDVVVVARARIAEAEYADVEREFRSVLERGLAAAGLDRADRPSDRDRGPAGL